MKKNYLFLLFFCIILPTCAMQSDAPSSFMNPLLTKKSETKKKPWDNCLTKISGLVITPKNPQKNSPNVPMKEQIIVLRRKDLEQKPITPTTARQMVENSKDITPAQKKEKVQPRPKTQEQTTQSESPNAKVQSEPTHNVPKLPPIQTLLDEAKLLSLRKQEQYSPKLKEKKTRPKQRKPYDRNPSFCQVCKKPFTSTFDEHMATRWYICSYCQHIYSNIDTLETHKTSSIYRPK